MAADRAAAVHGRCTFVNGIDPRVKVADCLARAALRTARTGLLATALAIPCAGAFAQSPAPAPPLPSNPATRDARAASANSDLAGRRVEAVRVVGNSTVSSAVILNLVRTREGDRFDPQTVESDYQRIYGLKKFSNVEAKVEPTDTGVIVVFDVKEQKQINSISFVGNSSAGEFNTLALEPLVDIHKGESKDTFRIALARQVRGVVSLANSLGAE